MNDKFKSVKVELVDYTGKFSNDPAKYAAAMLLFIKNTRLMMQTSNLKDLLELPMSKLHMQLEQAARTIPSCWEFLNMTFLISRVSRAFTHQLVRTRAASFAQQSMRVVNVEEAGVTRPEFHHSSHEDNWMDAENAAFESYKLLLEGGMEIEDARGILPTNVQTNIAVSMNFRTFVELTKKRCSTRVQEEYIFVLHQMLGALEAAWPWINVFTNRDRFVIKKEILDKLKQEFPDNEALGIMKNIDELTS